MSNYEYARNDLYLRIISSAKNAKGLCMATILKRRYTCHVESCHIKEPMHRKSARDFRHYNEIALAKNDLGNIKVDWPSLLDVECTRDEKSFTLF